MQFDYLQMYFGDPLVIPTPDGKSITVTQPTIGDVIKIGEDRFFGTLNVFIANTTQFRLQLWDSGIDWNEISDFELFVLLYVGIDQEVANLLFKDLVFSEFTIAQKQEEGKDKPDIVLMNKKTGLVINQEVYDTIHQYLQEMFKMKPENEFTKDKILKEWWVNKDRREAERRALKKSEKFTIQPLISSMVNHPGFKYKLQELREVGVCEFYDSVQRLQIYESATAVMKGMFSGMVDSSKIKPDQYNWMKQF